MLVVLLINSLCIHSNIISHDCYHLKNNLNIYQNQSINYQISCKSQNIQNIDLNDMNGVNYISIHNESNVIITCPFISNDFEAIILSIYGRPKISFNNSCLFNQVEIYGSPTFNLIDNSIFSTNILYLHNQTYQFPFDFNYIYFSDNVTNQTLKQKNIQNKKPTSLYCSDNEFKIVLSDNSAKIQCGEYEKEQTIQYDNFKKYQYRVVNGSVLIINKCSSDEIISENVKIAYESLKFTGKKKITFDNFLNLDVISFYTKNDEPDTWIEIPNSENKCVWKNKSYSTQIYDDYFKRGWRKNCWNDYPYIFCCDSDLGPRNIIIISKAGSLAIIIFIISFIFVLFISLCSIAYYRYSKWRRVLN